MDVLTPKWLDYGPLGLLALVLIGLYLAYREFTKYITESRKFTETLAQSTIAMMKEAHDKAMVVQEKTAAAMMAIEAELRRQRECAEKEHEQILDGQKMVVEQVKAKAGG